MPVLPVKKRYIPVKMMPEVCVLLQNAIKVTDAKFPKIYLSRFGLELKL